MNSPGVDRQPISTAIQTNKLTLHHPQFEHVIATHQKHSGIGHGFPSSPGRAELQPRNAQQQTQVTMVPLNHVRHAMHPNDQPPHVKRFQTIWNRLVSASTASTTLALPMQHPMMCRILAYLGIWDRARFGTPV